MRRKTILKQCISIRLHKWPNRDLHKLFWKGGWGNQLEEIQRRPDISKFFCMVIIHHDRWITNREERGRTKFVTG